MIQILRRLEATLAPLLSVIPSYKAGQNVDDSPEIVSSQEAVVNIRRNLPIIRIVTSILITYSFATTTIKQSFTLVRPHALYCLPVGYTVC